MPITKITSTCLLSLSQQVGEKKAMPRIKLTKKAIDKLPVPKKEYGIRYYDNSLAGFGLIVRPTGRKTFFIDYGKERRRMKLGDYGMLTLEQARQEARIKLVSVLGGEDPIEERTTKRNALTFGDWADRPV